MTMKVRVYQLDGTVADINDIEQLVICEIGTPLPISPVAMNDQRTLILIRENIAGFVTTPTRSALPRHT